MQPNEPTLSERIADRITAFSGTMAFLWLNAGIFAVWIVANTLGSRLFHFDPYPFQFLTMAVSLEAIFLSIFVLISENRQAARDRQTNAHDLQVDLESRKRIEEIGKQINSIVSSQKLDTLSLETDIAVFTAKIEAMATQINHIEQMLKEWCE